MFNSVLGYRSCTRLGERRNSQTFGAPNHAVSYLAIAALKPCRSKRLFLEDCKTPPMPSNNKADTALSSHVATAGTEQEIAVLRRIRTRSGRTGRQEARVGEGTKSACVDWPRMKSSGLRLYFGRISVS